MECHNCGDVAFSQCGTCNSAYYCDKVCQMQHYKIHKPICIEKSAKSYAKRNKVMKEFREGKLHAGSKKGPIVTDEKQAWAIAYSEANKY
jgi:hypothetical protein